MDTENIKNRISKKIVNLGIEIKKNRSQYRLVHHKADIYQIFPQENWRIY
jgi:hypothetical protein